MATIDFGNIDNSQAGDSNLKDLLANTENPLKLKKYPLAAGKTL